MVYELLQYLNKYFLKLKLKNEEEMSKYHKKLNKKDMEDQLCLAGLFCNLGNYTDALTIYKGVLSADKYVYLNFKKDLNGCCIC